MVLCTSCHLDVPDCLAKHVHMCAQLLNLVDTCSISLRIELRLSEKNPYSVMKFMSLFEIAGIHYCRPSDSR